MIGLGVKIGGQIVIYYLFGYPNVTIKPIFYFSHRRSEGTLHVRLWGIDEFEHQRDCHDLPDGLNALFGPRFRFLQAQQFSGENEGARASKVENREWESQCVRACRLL